MPEGFVLGVFVKAPLAGRVKIRLAAAIGPEAAAALYRRLGTRVVRSVTSDAYRTAVWYAPRRHGALVREWLRAVGVSGFHPQSGGSLGDRLRAAFATHLAEGALRVVLIGSDCPGVDRRVIGEAFAGLDDHDVVLGPARDGGYYLIGMKALHEPLFRGILWSSAGVLGETRAIARRLDLSCGLLRRLRDVDTVADARALGLMPPSRLDTARVS
ncbi:MAG: TIGR04282 family arsenosugar biosynthesis glycosyltransferase [Gemmatimonadales bacterium]